MKILVLFVQYDTVKYPDSYKRLEAQLATLQGIRWVRFRIDNARPFQGVEQVGDDCYSLGGDNTDWEFSGWQLGLEQASRMMPEYDGVLFGNDSFEVSGASLLSSIGSFHIKLFIRMNIPIGNVNSLRSDEKIYDIKIRKWIRTNCFILSRKTVERLGKIVFINNAMLDDFIDKDYTGNYFKDSAPLSLCLQHRVVEWLSKEWHSCFTLEDNWNLFRSKTKSMLNEWLLGSKLFEISPFIISNESFSGKGVLRFFLRKINAIPEKLALRPNCEMGHDRTFRHETLRHLPPDAKYILDVGCGTGSLGHHLMLTRQAIVWGVEPDPLARAEAEKKLTKAVNRPFDKLFDSEGQLFDAIFFNNVLEYMEYPYEALRLAGTLLARDGVIISSIPNLRHHRVLRDLLFKKNFPYAEQGVSDYTDLRFFTSKTILKMYEECGFHVIAHEGINHKANTFITALSKLFPLFSDIPFLQFCTVAKKA